MSRLPWGVDAPTRTRERKREKVVDTSLIAAKERKIVCGEEENRRRDKDYTAKTKDNDGNGPIQLGQINNCGGRCRGPRRRRAGS